MSEIGERISIVKNNIEAAKKRAGRANEVLLVGVTKFQTAELINESIKNGITVIGENKAQELCEKFDKIDKSADAHFIGHLQTNKVKYIIDKVSLIHSVDSASLMDEINKQAKKHNKVMDILIEVNVSGEESKFGCAPENVYSLMEYAKEKENIFIRGLMTMAPLTSELEETRKYFKELYQLYVDIKQKKYDNVSMDFLSMGMSGDYEIAVEEGANIVRVGSFIYGKRNYNL